MPFDSFMDHRCDIYHAISKKSLVGYGLPDIEEFEYTVIPDIENQKCHFNVKSGGITIVQGEPQTEASGRIKLSLPSGVDIRINDKIVSKESGISYRAEIPRNIRGHHIAVYLNRENGSKGAI